MKKIFTLLLAAAVAFGTAELSAQRSEYVLKKNWTFHRGDVPASPEAVERVTVPHDWAIYGPFDRANDLQTNAVFQNGETIETVKTGRTGGLPYTGVGVYETTFEVDQTAGRRFVLLFDGAMSEARVYVNDTEVGYWPYGYNTFYCRVDSAVTVGTNRLRVRLENREQSSRWYSGAGLYRNVHLIVTDAVHVPVWGTHVVTPTITAAQASVKLTTEIAGAAEGETVVLTTTIEDPAGRTVAVEKSESRTNNIEQNFVVPNPQLWSPEAPNLYRAVTEVACNGRTVDRYATTFGLRTIEYRPEEGFLLNGLRRKFHGVCNHHDLGPLGAAVNASALRHRLTMLKDMGVDAIRTSHNMPSPELVELCDQMGFMLMVETFDEWNTAKCEGGYHRFFDEWAEKDVANLVRHYRNNPSVVMWSIGNEVPSQWTDDGIRVARMLQDIVHHYDPTRPVTCGMDQVDAVLSNGFAAAIDIPGLNYRTGKFVRAYNTLPQKIMLGTETASTVSSRGVYKFPVEPKGGARYADHQSSSYDTEFCSWSNLPDEDLALADDYDWYIGQFVWTGFDYLGEPSPYDTDDWPSHSSLFGIIDLASIPKDRYYLYRSIWNRNSPTLHILPHWNWGGREGELTPVFIYTSYPSAELFINGRSQGVRRKDNSTVMNRYRLMWNETRYEAGEVRVVAYDAEGRPAAEKSIRTTGRPYALKLETTGKYLTADGEDLAYITVKVVDRDGLEVPTADNLVRFEVKGEGVFRAAANGDPTCLYPFQNPEMPLFSGAATAIVQATERAGRMVFKARSKGLKSAEMVIETVAQ